MRMKSFITGVMLLSTLLAQAQGQSAPASPGLSGSTLMTIIILLVLVLLFQSFVVRRLIGLVNELQYKVKYGKEMPADEPTAEAAVKKREDTVSRIFKSLTRSNPAGKQKDVMLDHNYDGIQELDNIMPPWLQIILYGSIIFAVVYLLLYHVYDIGKLPKDEYAQELLMAQQQKEERLKTVGASLDETSVMQLTDAQTLQSGKIIFISRCSPCHGLNLEGNVGPNLTDDYWLHGGSVSDIFKTVKYGVPAKGMVPWQGVLKPEEMQSVVSYVMSMHGSNPPNGKAPQGALYSPQVAASDSTTIKADSTKKKS